LADRGRNGSQFLRELDERVAEAVAEARTREERPQALGRAVKAVCQDTLDPIDPYRRHRFPAEIISHCVWLYFRFCLSYRDVEELMAERGVILTYEAVRYWCRTFGQAYANQLRHR
jgi:hypothetical protein